MPKVSVIIPCYNQGIFVQDAVDSILNQTFDDYEIIIVNDGSTDEFTNKLLSDYNRPKTTVITTKNRGLAAARNTGINAAKGEYILPLDADDKIGTTYLEQAIQILDTDDSVGIVYCLARFFGADNSTWNLPEYSMSEMLNSNCIFCSALFRKRSWDLVGGYKESMKYGWEDYEFWLSLIESGCGVYRIPSVLFFYRQHPCSTTHLLRSEPYRLNRCWRQIFSYHRDLYLKNYALLNKYIKTKFDLFMTPSKNPLRTLFIKIFRSKETFDTYRYFCSPDNLSGRNIAFLLPHIVMGGVEKVLLEFINEIRRQAPNWNVSVYSLNPVTENWILEFFRLNNIKLNDGWGRYAPRGLLRKMYCLMRHPVSSIMNQRRILRELSGCDVLLDFQFFAWGDKISKIPVPKITWVHGSIIHFNRYRERALKHIDDYNMVVCLSNAFKTDFIEQWPQYQDKIISIYNPINVENIRANAQVCNQNGRYFCVVSRLDDEKDIETTISAFKIFAATHADAKLLIVGRGPLQEKLTRMSENYPQIQFLGQIDTPYTLIKNSVAHILSSYGEGLPTVLLENAALGTLSICSNCKSGPSEILLDGRAGLMFAPGNVTELAQIMSDVWDEKINPKSFIECATNNLYRFSAYDNTARLIQIIERVSSENVTQAKE